MWRSHHLFWSGKSWSRGAGLAATIMLKHLASILSWPLWCVFQSWLCTRLHHALMHSCSMCIRGARAHQYSILANVCLCLAGTEVHIRQSCHSFSCLFYCCLFFALLLQIHWDKVSLSWLVMSIFSYLFLNTNFFCTLLFLSLPGHLIIHAKPTPKKKDKRRWTRSKMMDKEEDENEEVVKSTMKLTASGLFSKALLSFSLRTALSISQVRISKEDRPMRTSPSSKLVSLVTRAPREVASHHLEVNQNGSSNISMVNNQSITAEAPNISTVNSQSITMEAPNILMVYCQSITAKALRFSRGISPSGLLFFQLIWMLE